MTTSELDSWIAALPSGWTDLCLNGPTAYLDRGGALAPLPAPAGLDETRLRAWVVERLARAGRSWDARQPFVDATLAEEGLRLHAVFPPVSRLGVLVSLRRLPRAGCGPAEAEKRAERWRSSPLYPRLARIVREGQSLIVSGATGSGKTTLANDLLAEVAPSERIVALEDTPELAPAHPHFVSLLSRPANADGFGAVTLRDLLRQTLRMRPDRVVLGECRGPEVLELLQALNTGHRGALATLHANSPRDALRRIELLCLLAGAGDLPWRTVRELVACGVEWVAQVRRVGAAREIAELWRLEGREGDTILLRQVLDSG